MTNEFKAGVGRVDITPPLTMPHASWGAQVHVFADGVEWPLFATALILDDGTTRAVVIDLDIVVVTPEEDDAIRKAAAEVAGVDPSMVLTVLSHNHAGPPPSAWNWAKLGQAEMDGYFAMLGAYSAGAVRIALDNLQPAAVNAGSGESYVAVNRREVAPDGRPVTGANADGVIDPQVLVVRIDGADGSPLAAIVGYTMHPTTMGPTNKLVGPDWPGHTRATVEQLTGATCLFLQGCCGNVGPGFDGFTDDLDVVRTIGKRVGCTAAEVYLGLDVPAVERVHERIWESGAPLATWKKVPINGPAPKVQLVTKQVALPVLEQPEMWAVEKAVADAQAILDELKADNATDEEIALATYVVKRSNMAHWRAETYGGKSHIELNVTALMIGDIALVMSQGEPFAEIGLEVKARSPFEHTWFGGYQGSWSAYIPIASEYPNKGYEVDTTPYAPEAAVVLVEAGVGLLNSIEV